MQTHRVDDSCAAHRIDAEPPPGQIDERNPRDQFDVDAGGPYELDTAFGDCRAARDCVDDLAAFACGLDDTIGDRGVHRVEIVGLVVEQIERLEVEAVCGKVDDGRMARRADEADRNALERRGAAGRSRSAPAGPSPTTTTRGLFAIYGVPTEAPGLVTGTVVVVVVVVPFRCVLGDGGFGGLTSYTL